jgi:RimJ/RimL family protein N-acetyltransferase
MTEEVIKTRLIEFIEIARRSNIDFAEITYSCGAHDFVNEDVELNLEDDRFIRSYTFKDFYTNWKYADCMSYYVLAILNKAYLMYEVNEDSEEITIWVCYTEVEHRGKGYMTMLLNSLKNNYLGVRITVDTFNEKLRKICKDLGINLFR